MKILVTGNEGYVGSYLTEYLIERGIEVVGCDLKSGDEFSEFFKKYPNIAVDINAVVHLAAYIYVTESEYKRTMYMYNNIVRSVNFINDCRKRNLPFIFISTNAVYLEDGEVNPQNTYGATKLTIEKYLQESYDADYQIFRLANPIGLYPCHIPYLKDFDATIASVLFKLAECKINNHVFHVHEMNEMVRDFVPLNFVAFMIYKRLTEPETFKLPIYPIGSNTATQIVPTLIELCQKFNINFDMIAPPAGVERGFIMNSEKILSTITGQKQVYLDLKTALQQYIDIMEPNIT